MIDKLTNSELRLAFSYFEIRDEFDQDENNGVSYFKGIVS